MKKGITAPFLALMVLLVNVPSAFACTERGTGNNKVWTVNLLGNSVGHTFATLEGCLRAVKLDRDKVENSKLVNRNTAIVPPPSASAPLPGSQVQVPSNNLPSRQYQSPMIKIPSNQVVQ